MNRKSSALWLFYSLGILFFLVSRNFESTTLLCVFYSFFVGTVWSMVPMVSGEMLSWKHLLPPFLLIVLMMFSVKLKLVLSTDVVLFTAMSLIHFRASILSFARLGKNTRLFSWVQLFSFVFGLAYVFQKNISSVTLSRSNFLICINTLSVMSLTFLFYSKRKYHEPIGSQTSSS